MVPSYSSFLTANAARINSIESSLRSLTWFLPGRFQDAELASEALYSGLNTVGLYHDNVLMKAADSLPLALRPPPSSHGRYTRQWSERSATYGLASYLLSVVSYTELLMEMIARRRLGSEKRWRIVLVIECFKAMLRLQLLRITGRLLVHPAAPEREIDPQVFDLAERRACLSPASDRHIEGPYSNGTNTPESTSEGSWRGTRTGLERPTIASLCLGSRSSSVSVRRSVNSQESRKQVNDYLMSKVLTIEEVRSPEDLVRRLRHGTPVMGELLWIVRPIFYVLALRKYGRQHTAPFLLSLALEYLARSLRNEAFRSELGGGPVMTDLEKGELAKRQRAFWWYILRGPMWDKCTRPRLEWLIGKLEGKPVVGIFAMIIKDYTPLIDDYYYYTA